jgi:hypothetical protein
MDLIASIANSLLTVGFTAFFIFLCKLAAGGIFIVNIAAIMLFFLCVFAGSYAANAVTEAYFMPEADDEE